jgi:biopolymer transport protein ExbB/TolQ
MDTIDVSHFTLTGMWGQMGLTARIVVFILFLMSVWSLGFAIERALRFHRARKQSLKVALGITPLLKDNRLDEAISYATRSEFEHSHIARVVAAGLQEFKFETSLATLPPDFDVVASANRAIERETLMRTADFKKGLGNLATIATTAPFVGLFGTVIGIINSFRGMALSGSGGIGAVSAGIAEALFATALGLGVAIPAVWLYNHFMNKVERFHVEMRNASSEMVDYFLKHKGA